MAAKFRFDYGTLAKMAQASNEEFASASPAKRRWMIAKDVIEQLELGKFKPVQGSYVSGGWYGKCNVCAIGASIISGLCLQTGSVEQGIKVSMHSRDAQGGVFPRFALESFDSVMLNEMEAAFEKWNPYRYREIWCDMSDEERLRAIMQNIVDNCGNFKPELLPGG